MIRRLEWTPRPWRVTPEPVPWTGAIPIWVMQALWVLAEYRHANTPQLVALAWPDVKERQGRNRLHALWTAGWVQYTGVFSQAFRGQGRYPRVWALTPSGDAQVRQWTRSWNPEQIWPDWESPWPLYAIPRFLHDLELVDLAIALRHVFTPERPDPWTANPAVLGTRRAWRRFPAPGGAVILAPDLLILDHTYGRRPILVEYERFNDRDKYWGKLQRLAKVLANHTYRTHFPVPPLMLTVIWREAGPTRPHGDRSRHAGLGLSVLAQRSGIRSEHLAFLFADELTVDKPGRTQLLAADGSRSMQRLADAGLPNAAVELPEPRGPLP